MEEPSRAGLSPFLASKELPPCGGRFDLTYGALARLFQPRRYDVVFFFDLLILRLTSSGMGNRTIGGPDRSFGSVIISQNQSQRVTGGLTEEGSGFRCSWLLIFFV